MKTCYLGESFEQEFTIYDARDKTKPISSATFSVSMGGEILYQGALSVHEDGHTASFRFNATHPGTVTIWIEWRMGDDIWRQPFLMDVIE